jgi:hypothetical protein
MTTSSRPSCQKELEIEFPHHSPTKSHSGCGHALEAMELPQGSRSIPCTRSVSESSSNDLLHDYCPWPWHSTLLDHKGSPISQCLPIRSAEFPRASMLRTCSHSSGSKLFPQHSSHRLLETFSFGRHIEIENGSLKPHGHFRAATDAEAREHGRKSS